MLEYCFRAVSEGILFPPNSAEMSFPADLAEPVNVGVAGLADAGILFPAVSEGILFPTDPVEERLPGQWKMRCTPIHVAMSGMVWIFGTL